MVITTSNIENLPTIHRDTINQTARYAGVSDKYAQVPTSRMLTILADYGWLPSSYSSANVRNAKNLGFQKHALRLRNANIAVQGVGEYVPEIVLINSHMGSAAFKLLLGAYRFYCANGIVCGDTYTTESVRHSGFADSEAEAAIARMVDRAPRVIEAIEGFRTVQLAEPERIAFAESAIELIKDEDEKFAIQPAALLRTRRYEDRTDASLWGMFNVIQENVIKGGFRRTEAATGYRAPRARAIKSVDRNLAVNRALWTLTEKMAALKTMNA